MVLDVVQSVPPLVDVGRVDVGWPWLSRYVSGSQGTALHHHLGTCIAQPQPLHSHFDFAQRNFHLVL